LGDDVANITTGNALVKNGGLHGIQYISGSINLTENTYYPIRILFGEATGGEVMLMKIVFPDQVESNGTGYLFDENTILKQKVDILSTDKLLINFENNDTSFNIDKDGLMINKPINQNVNGSNSIMLGNNLFSNMPVSNATLRNIGIGSNILSKSDESRLNITIGNYLFEKVIDGYSKIGIGNFLSTYGYNNICMGSLCGNSNFDTTVYNNSICIGTDVHMSDSNQIRLGNETHTTYIQKLVIGNELVVGIYTMTQSILGFLVGITSAVQSQINSINTSVNTINERLYKLENYSGRHVKTDHYGSPDNYLINSVIRDRTKNITVYSHLYRTMQKNSTLYITFDCKYVVNGSGGDSINSYIEIYYGTSMILITYKKVNFGDTNNIRNSNIILFPITGKFETKAPKDTNFKIFITVFLGESDDTLTIDTNHWNFTLSEFQ
jgi:hypothetical protein